jgi:microcystin-dependent protein
MSDPYIGEIRMFGGNFPPAGWMFCDGALLPIAENDALFTLLGTTYGGDGQSNFGLPDLRGRVPLHQGTGASGTYIPGQNGGAETVTLSTPQLPVHTHPGLTTGITSSISPAGSVLGPVSAPASVVNPKLYGSDNPLVQMNAASITPVGGSQPHDNIQPSLGINFIISLFGIFPTQN